MHEFFRVVWLVFSGGMGSIGLYLTQRLLRSSGHEFRFDGDAMNVHLRTYARGRVIDGKSFARSSVMDLRSSVSGNYNGLPMKRVEMIVGDKVETLATWIEGGEADDFLSEARQALGMS
jgi:hypothetical protein